MLFKQVVHRSQIFAVIFRCKKGLHLGLKMQKRKATGLVHIENPGCPASS
jgi:hypothetical protein